ncbi:MAG: FAD-dependent oxidoreductase [Bacillota bacterium]
MRRLLVVLVVVTLVVGAAVSYRRLNPSMITEQWDVIVVGSEPEGVMAGIAAARSGAKTLLVTPDPILGRTMTLAKLNSLDMSFNSKNELLTRGLFEEWWQKVDRAFSFVIEDAIEAFDTMVKAEPNLTVRKQTQLVRVEQQKSTRDMTGLILNDSGQVYRARGLVFIDATADANLAAATGVRYIIGRDDIGQPGVTMAPTLVFEVSGVNWDEIVRYVRGLRDPRYGVTQDSAWAYWEIAARYQPADPKTYLRGLNIGRQGPDRVLINALLIFDIDVLDDASKQQGIMRGTAEAKRIVEFLQKEAPGFAHASFVGVAPQLYIRESRYIDGLYRLTLEDVFEEKHHWDEIAVGAYPVDIQAVSPQEREKTLYAPVNGYGIPFRCLVPAQGPDNLLVIGRSASYGSQPAGSARVIPVGMVEGQAAGVAAVQAIQKKVGFRELAADRQAIGELQQKLLKQGAYLRPTK